MKILKIDNGNGYYSLDDGNNWVKIDEIDKDGLMKLLDLFLENEVDIDEYDEAKLTHQAQQIIYKSLFDKLSVLEGNKSKFKDESDRLYLSEMQRYQIDS